MNKDIEYKLLILDMDKTLLDKEHNISKETINTIHAVCNLGVKVMVATGRMYCSAAPLVDEIGLKGPIITYNGAYIKENTNDEILYHRPVPLDTALSILKDAEEKGLYANIYIDDELFSVEQNKFTENYRKISGIKARSVGTLSKFIDRPPTKVLVYTEDEHDKNLDFFEKKYKDKVEVTVSHDGFIDFMAEGVSKGNAVKYFADKLNISMKEVIAVGDSWNDLDMIKKAGLGIAMGNAAEEIRKSADMVAPPHDQEGVRKILQKVFKL